ncbi:MAG TPA: hypothetical protein PLF42_08180, partial [Anaerolineales bacterium]|nr:hypothetical protein [Anaerolineales bacterium]
MSKFLKNIKFGRPTIPQVIFWAVTVVLAVTAFIAVKSFAECWTFTNLPGIAPDRCGASQDNGFALKETSPDGLPPAPPSLLLGEELPPA